MKRSVAAVWASLLSMVVLLGLAPVASAQQRTTPAMMRATSTRTSRSTSTAWSGRNPGRNGQFNALRRPPANRTLQRATARATNNARTSVTASEGLGFLGQVDRTQAARVVASHAVDDPTRDGAFGVFDGGAENASALVDEAFRRAQEPDANVHVDTRGDRTTVTIDMGRRVGFVGGALGASQGQPEARHVRLVLAGGRMVTAYPLRVTSPLRGTRAPRATTRRTGGNGYGRGARRGGDEDDVAVDQSNDTEPRLAAPTRAIGEGRRESPSTLVYDRRSPDGDSTAAVLRHTRDDASAQGDHGVFDGDPSAAFGLIDEAYGRVLSYEREGSRSGASGSGRVRVTEETDARGALRRYTVDMGRRIGYIGGRAGAAAGHPAAGEIELIVRDHTLVSARPVRANNTDPRTRPNFVRLPRVPMARVLTRLAVDPSHPADQDVADDHLMVNTGARAVVSYNADTMEPNVVAWTLEQSDLGEAERTDFREDDSLPEQFPRALTDALRHSPFDRGHLLPRSDRTGNQDDANATFVTGTNMVPQLAESNQGAWNRLESELRRQVSDEGRQVMIFAGPVFEGPQRRVGGIAVPRYTYKIAVVMDRGQDWNSVNANTRVISVLMPNTEGSIHIGDTWQQFAHPAADIVRRAPPALGRMLDRLPPAVRQAINDPSRAMDVSHLPVTPGEHEATFRHREYGQDARRWTRGGRQ